MYDIGRALEAERVMTAFYWRELTFAAAISELADLHPHVDRLELARRLYLLALQSPRTCSARTGASLPAIPEAAA